MTQLLRDATICLTSVVFGRQLCLVGALHPLINRRQACARQRMRVEPSPVNTILETPGLSTTFCGDICKLSCEIQYKKSRYIKIQRKSNWNHICADVLSNLKFDNRLVVDFFI